MTPQAPQEPHLKRCTRGCISYSTGDISDEDHIDMCNGRPLTTGEWGAYCERGCASFDDGSRPTPSPDPTYEDLVKFARWTQTFWSTNLKRMRDNNLVIDSLNDPMQKLAFTLHSDLCQIDREAQHLFHEGPGDENYVDPRVMPAKMPEPQPDPITEIYEKYKHLDVLLGDADWCDIGIGKPCHTIYGIAGELWRAIKVSREGCEK